MFIVIRHWQWESVPVRYWRRVTIADQPLQSTARSCRQIFISSTSFSWVCEWEMFTLDQVQAEARTVNHPQIAVMLVCILIFVFFHMNLHSTVVTVRATCRNIKTICSLISFNFMFSPRILKVSHFIVRLMYLIVKTQSLKSTLYQCFKRQLKTPTCFVSFVIHPQGVLNVLD